MLKDVLANDACVVCWNLLPMLGALPPLPLMAVLRGGPSQTVERAASSTTPTTAASPVPSIGQPPHRSQRQGWLAVAIPYLFPLLRPFSMCLLLRVKELGFSGSLFTFLFITFGLGKDFW